jgi:hypothetical protein
VHAGDRPAARRADPVAGPTLIDAVTYFSWLLRVGATGILPVYAAVGVAGAVFAARTCGSAVDRSLAPLLAVVVTAAAEVTEFTGSTGSSAGRRT